ncbi:MAG: PilN domain-containing protein [Gallionella sp.]|nr:PilN domain-containing protein [Gallionella sp.]
MSLQINLLNPLLKKRSSYFSLLTMLQALGFIILGSLLFYGYAVYQERLLNNQFGEDTKRFDAEKARMILLEAEFSPQQTNQALQEEVQQLEKKLAAQAELIETLKASAGGNTAGYSEYMRAFARQALQGLWLTGFKVVGDAAEISLSGAALNPELLPVYIQRLGKEKIMHGKTFSTLQIQTSAGKEPSSASPPRYVEFTLSSTPDDKAKK